MADVERTLCIVKPDAVEKGVIGDILRRVGVKPRSHPPSTQKLLELAWKRGTLPAVNNLVDVYNFISVRTGCSLGAHDLDRISSPVDLRLLAGDEQFISLGCEKETSVHVGEFGYIDADDRVLCRLDSLQAEFSKVTHETVNALLIIEATTAHTTRQIEQAFSDATELIARFCGGTAEVIARP